LTTRQVRFLLMGGQACIFYGGAEFSRDTDIVIAVDSENLDRLKQALADLQARRIAVPEFSEEYLRRGHAIHFRCYHPEAEGTRLDVMTVLRGVSTFEELWLRRATVEIDGAARVEVMALPDLVAAKKTQRDKDWPMIRRLLEAHYGANKEAPNAAQCRFWLLELRTPWMLEEVARRFPGPTGELVESRPLLAFAAAGDREKLEAGLQEEEKRERDADRAYWLPLRKELEQMRLQRQNARGTGDTT